MPDWSRPQASAPSGIENAFIANSNIGAYEKYDTDNGAVCQKVL